MQILLTAQYFLILQYALPPNRQALREAAQQVAAGRQDFQTASEELQRGLGLDTRPLVRPSKALFK